MTATPPPDPPPPPPPPTGGTPPTWQQAPPPPPAAVPPRPTLRRSTSNRVLGGVCGGLAEYTGVEALLWRIGFVALALLGAGVLVYPLLWILLPAGTAPTEAAPAPRLRETLQNGRTPNR